MRRAVPFLLIALALACIVAAGPRSWGKLALTLGQDALAARLIDDPGARGVALYRAGRFAAADDAFREAGRGATYNRGLTLALTGEYDLSVAYFNAVLFARPEDSQARENRDIVAEFTTPVIGETSARGRIETVVAAATEAREALEAAVPSGRRRRLQRKEDPRSVVATEAWLETLGDAPAEYLAKRLQVEYDRRAAQGLVVPDGGAPW